MSDQLFKVLADGESSPAEKLRRLAVFARESLNACFVEFRLDGVGEWAEGERPQDVYRLAIGPAARPIGEMFVAPVPPDGDERSLIPYARCAELIHRLQEGYIDNLTGLYNRRRLDTELANALMSDERLSIVMMDIDHFKHVNDTYGHDAGDAVLREFAARLAQQVSDGGFAARYGGEEFCLIFRGVTETAAAETAENIRQAVSAEPIRHRSAEIRITSSAGVAEGAGAGALKLADEALYAAKTRGRNQTVRASERRLGAVPARRRRQIVWPRPLADLVWFGRRVVGFDRVIRRMVAIDSFGGATPIGPDLPDALSAVRVGPRTVVAPFAAAGLQVVGPDGIAGTAALSELSEIRRIVSDPRLKRFYVIARTCGESFAVSEDLMKCKRVFRPKDASLPPYVTAILPLGESLLVLDPLARAVELRDRSRLGVKERWTIPQDGYEVCLCYLTAEKCVAAGGASGLTIIGSDGRVRETRADPMISAYDHPEVGWVVSTPEETVVIR